MPRFASLIPTIEDLGVLVYCIRLSTFTLLGDINEDLLRGTKSASNSSLKLGFISSSKRVSITFLDSRTFDMHQGLVGLKPICLH
jgi:hypothetical protein